MKTRWLRLIIAIIVATGACLPETVQAAKGTPNSTDFGYGIRLDIDGLYLAESLQTAADLRVDWINVEFDWSRRWPDPSTSPDFSNLDIILQAAQASGAAVLLSLSRAPAWAMAPEGPDAGLTASLVVTLAQRYPTSLQAVELFPGANTWQAWGAEPNPLAYANLLKTNQAALQNAGMSLLIVAAGLTPLPAEPTQPDMDDLTFLQGLYLAGVQNEMPVISLRLAGLTGDPLQAPGGVEHRILRHYEEVRQVMLDHGHAGGLLWITTFSPHSGTIQTGGGPAEELTAQARWLTQAYQQMRAQLYLGVVFYDRLNPPSLPPAEPAGETTSLIRTDHSLHPFYPVLRQLIAQNNHSLALPARFCEPTNKQILKDRY